MGEASDFLADSHPTLPAGWSWRLFTDVLDIEGGTQPPASEFADELLPGHVRLVQIRDFDSDAHLTYIPDSKKWRKCEKRDVLIARYGAALGRICRGLSGAYNVALAKVVPTEHVEIDFVNYLLRSQWFQAPLLASGGRSAQAGFNKGTLAVIPLPIPPLPEQGAIAGVLGTLDDKIEQNRRTARALERLARAIFKAWFVDFEPVKAKAAGATAFPSMPQPIFDALPISFVDSDIGPVPEGWEVKAVSEVFDVNPTLSLRKGEPAPYLDMKSMPTNGHAPASWIERPFGSGMRFTNGDTLVARITPCLENGKTAFVDFLGDGQIAWGSTEYIVLRPQPPLPPVFAYCLARTGEFRDFAIQNMTGTSGRQRVSPNAMDHFRLAVPSEKAVAAEFGEVVNPMFECIRGGMEESRKLAALRDYLLPRLLGGRVGVCDARAEPIGSAL